MSIRVFIVEDHPVMRGTLVEFLQMTPELEVCGTAESAEEALNEIEAADPTLVLLDLSLPERDGHALLKEIRERWRFPCIVLTGQGGPEMVHRASEAGAAGFLRKGKPWEIPKAIRCVAGGGRYFPDALDLDGEGAREARKHEG